ncbi:hypothetical protein SARC_09452 [Sphaeroforma arctica JP610]|uniref:Stc1 domain-containing protein n=1 Tax=Sphaeroforma arctica JP610 TaxID=667725 RepID=A0A0L0FNT4_9EUKA|nr:hypothetical protein SARC_09452 [Sphaeroforma arctica JP610]KNC78101.1 hypothetical protein SARC_09452 [Sphaeroforma arctica JP610]|eukprot:XP_014152003.1 hypothetical protein SARC_09452 [Sphaeroforma arctica JP610]
MGNEAIKCKHCVTKDTWARVDILSDAAKYLSMSKHQKTNTTCCACTWSLSYAHFSKGQRNKKGSGEGVRCKACVAKGVWAQEDIKNSDDMTTTCFVCNRDLREFKFGDVELEFAKRRARCKTCVDERNQPDEYWTSTRGRRKSREKPRTRIPVLVDMMCCKLCSAKKDADAFSHYE